MSWFYNLKIRTKLFLGFGSIALIAGLIGLIAILEGKTADDKDTFLYEKTTVPLGQLGSIASDFGGIRLYTYRLGYSQNVQENQTYIDKIKDLDDEIKKNLKAYESTFIDESDKKNYDNLRDLYLKFFSVYQEEQRLVLEGKTENVQYMLGSAGELTKAGLNVMEQLEQMLNSNVATAKRTSDENTENFESTQQRLIIFILIGIAIAVGLGLFISNYISKNLNLVADRVNQLQSVCITNLGNGLQLMAKGDLSASIEKSTKHLNLTVKDEIGQMAMSIDNMITKSQNGIDAYQQVRDIVKMLAEELNKLIKDAENGLLDNRGDINKFQGVYKDLIRGLNNMLDAVIVPVQEGARVLEDMASGDFTKKVEADYKGQHKMIKESINRLGEAIGSALSDVNEAVQATASAANEISSSSEEMAAGAQEQSQQTTEVAGAIEEMTSTIIETSKNAALASENSRQAYQAAAKGAEKVEATKQGIHRIVTSAQHTAGIIASLAGKTEQIGEITQVIDDIADQTNLLALNAAIEAARAGEQGRGFAVVADEVRKLAERTTKATKEIAETIRAIQKEAKDADSSMMEAKSSVEEGMRLTEEVDSALKEILGGSNKLSDIVNQVAAASEQQSGAAEQISKNIEGISSVIQQSAAGTEQIARAAEDLNRLTVNLQDLISRFKLKEGQNRAINNRLAVKSNGTLIRQ